MSVALLVDVTRCTGCERCAAACVEANRCDRSAAETSRTTTRDGLSANRWCTVVPAAEGRFARKSCMHCLDPSCVAACLVGGLRRTAQGPVVYDPDKCIGCRYCMLACPFQVPKFEWSKALPLIAKCTMCTDRVLAGEIPACAKACPTGAITFGDRDDLLREAEDRIRHNPSGYVPYIYGKDEVGGTCVLHLSRVPFEQVGYKTDLPTRPLGSFTHAAMSAVPGVMVGLGVVLSGTYAIIQRRMDLAQKSEDPTGEEGEEK
jgi:formate dehydrogenase iron-sulfur subunit